MMENLYTKSNFTGKKQLSAGISLPEDNILSGIINRIPRFQSGYFKKINFYDDAPEYLHNKLKSN